MQRKMGPASILTPEKEHKICDWVQNMAKAGFPVTTKQLIVSVEKYSKDTKPEALQIRAAEGTLVYHTVSHHISSNSLNCTYALNREILTG